MASRRGVRLLWSAVILLALLVGLAGAAFWYLGPIRAPQDETFVDIERGMSTRSIADMLAQQGLIRSNWAFLAARALCPPASR